MLENIKALTEISGVSGNEKQVAAFILANISDCCETSVDPLGNIIAVKKGKKTPKNKILISAHMDEVGFIITYIEDNGMLRFSPVGGIDSKLVGGKRVFVGDKKVPASIGIKAIHQQKSEERTKIPEYDSLYMDIGADSREEAEKWVSLGDTCCFDHNWCELGDGMLRAKALDNRVACAMLIDLLHEEAEYDISCAFTVQEETGCVGAKTVGNSVKPDISIILETTTAGDIAGTDAKNKVCYLGKGPVVSFMDKGAIYSSELYKLAVKTAEENSIPVQTKAAVTGGNESRSLQVAGSGSKTLAISVACRYLHSPATMLAKKDIENSYKLLKKMITKAAEL